MHERLGDLVPVVAWRILKHSVAGRELNAGVVEKLLPIATFRLNAGVIATCRLIETACILNLDSPDVILGDNAQHGPGAARPCSCVQLPFILLPMTHD